jgi:hypothetical protein
MPVGSDINSSIDLASANHTNRELELMLEGKKPHAFFRERSVFSRVKRSFQKNALGRT